MKKDEIIDQLIEAYDNYLRLISKETESLISVAYVHGWRSKYVSEGEILRSKIAELKLAYQEIRD